VTYLLPVNTDQQDIPLSANLYFTKTPFIKDMGPTGCNQHNSIIFAVRDDGFEAPKSFSVQISVVHKRTGSTEQEFTSDVVDLEPGGTLELGIPWILPTLYPREGYRVTLTIDPQNGVPEMNEGDNSAAFDFTLLPTAQCGPKK